MQRTFDNRRARSELTKTALMRAAEKLIAEHGVENVSKRDIVSAAGQKNESALQYHFENFTGLINAIHYARSEAVREKRAEALTTMLEKKHAPSLRDLCELMVAPAFTLGRADAAYRCYIRAFGHQLALSDESPIDLATTGGGGGQSGQRLGTMLKSALPHLDEAEYRRRLEAALMLCSASMYRQARQRNAFRGHQSDLFLHNLIDALVGLLSGPVSPETKALSDKD